jgi:hypothetical protein
MIGFFGASRHGLTDDGEARAFRDDDEGIPL